MSLGQTLARQLGAFAGVGALAAVAHYGILIGAVEGWRIDPVPATLAGYVAGGVVSYALNRRLTYRSDRPHGEAGWRFAVVALVGFGLTWGLMSLLVRAFGAPYLPAQVFTTLVVMAWSFLAHKIWTFGVSSPAGARQRGGPFAKRGRDGDPA